jgi:hypothetical protein
MIMFCAIASLVACSTQKELNSVQAKRFVQSWLKAMETGNSIQMYNMLADKKSYGLADMKWIVEMRKNECPQVMWHQSKKWSVVYDDIVKCYIVTPFLDSIGNWPIAIRLRSNGMKIDLNYSEIDFTECPGKSTTNKNDY